MCPHCTLYSTAPACHSNAVIACPYSPTLAATVEGTRDTGYRQKDWSPLAVGEGSLYLPQASCMVSAMTRPVQVVEVRLFCHSLALLMSCGRMCRGVVVRLGCNSGSSRLLPWWRAAEGRIQATQKESSVLQLCAGVRSLRLRGLRNAD